MPQLSECYRHRSQIRSLCADGRQQVLQAPNRLTMLNMPSLDLVTAGQLG